MRCDEARDRLFQVELQAPDDGALTEHLEACKACAALRDRLIEGEAALDRAVGRLAGTVARDLDLEAVRVEAERRSGFRFPGWKSVVPLAAAAALAGVAFFGLQEEPDGSPSLPPEWTLPVAGLQSNRPVVESGSHDKVAVLPTDNPDITVVWFMDS